MKKAVFVGLVVALGIGLGGLALAHYAGYGGYGGHMMGRAYGSNYDGNGQGCGGCRYGDQASQLSPEQTKKLDQLRQKQWEETKGIREELSKKYQELESLSAQATPDQKAIGKLQKETFDLEQRLRDKDFTFDQEANRIAPQSRGSYGCGRGMRGRDPGRGRSCCR